MYYNKADYEVINTALHNITCNWETQMHNKTIDSHWMYFKESLRKIIYTLVTRRKITLKQSKRRGTTCDEKTLRKYEKNISLEESLLELRTQIQQSQKVSKKTS